ncbi:MAG: SprB repeat-containing protein, partial [Flavobacteriales bacterium]|nr:SprB repeat-containing protein [Flavobacteriales bacterium]
TGLCVGPVTGVVTDGNGCMDSASVTLTEPLPLNVSTTMTAASCFGVCDGSIATSVSGGTSPYTYGWSDPGTQTTGTALALCAGGFSVTVTDAGGCTLIVSDTVTEPVALVSNVVSIVNVSCNGLCDGSAQISVTGGSAPLTYLWSNGQTAPLATNLCGGTFTVDITDANGCTTSDTVLITEPAAMVNVFASTNVDCFGNATGIATANITGGSTPYTFLWDDLSFQTSASATGLVANTYTVQVTDSSGCTLADVIVITEPPAIAMTLDTTGANCGLSDGSTCVTVSAGVAPYTYLWDDISGQTTACANNIPSGSYNVTVTDNSGCTATALSVVNDLGAPTLAISAFSDASCNGGCDGFATVQILNGDPPYTYSWNDSLNQTTANAAGLCAGVYIVSILDSNSCSGSIAATIGEPTALSVIISGQIPTSCNASCDATADALGSGGTPPYSYQWNDLALQTTQTAVGLCVGTYGLTLIDANGCTDTTSVVIIEPPTITLSTFVVSANCGLFDGSATVTASGGNGLYGYLWDDPGSQITATAINLQAGTYSVIVTDILGCTAAATITVGDDPAGVASIPISIDVSCNGGADGSATVSMAGGTLPFIYSWDDPLLQTSSTATGLSAGLVTVSVTDSNGCVVTASTTIIEPAGIVVNVTGIDVSCKVGCDGFATAAPTGGTGAYTYQWDDPLAQTTNPATGLCAGQAIVTITDINGCSDTGSVVLGAPDSLVLSETHSDANCQQSNAIATVSVVGGTSPYNYSWNPGGQTTPFVTNLSAGTYIVTVTDANLCSESIAVTIADLNGPSVTITSSVDVSCYSGSDGQAVALASGGSPPYSYSWDDPLNQVTAAAASLPAGVHTITIVDTSGCIASTTVTITEPPLIVYNPASLDPACFGDCNGTVGVTVSGGTPPFQYLWNDGLAQTTATAVGLCSGAYIVIITDANSCSDVANVSIADPLPITSSVTFVDESCFGACDGSVTVNPNNGTGAYTYLWDDPFSQVTQTAGGLCVGTYNVVISDANGCLGNASSAVSGPGNLTVTISSSGNNACFGNCLGFAQTTLAGGSTPFTYLWSDGQTGAQAINLCAGIFDVTLTDGNGCTAQTSVTITEPQGMALNVLSSNVTCNLACDGSGTASVSGGVPPYTYIWNDGLFQSTAIATNLCAGFYGVTVTDASGCSQNGTIVLTEPQPLTLNITTVSSTCGFANGSACASVIGGSSPYVITWNDPNTTVGACIFNVFAGTYNPIVVDANGCTYTIPVVINDIVGPTIDSVTTTDVVCALDSNGTAAVVASGAAPPLTFEWKDNSGVVIGGNSTSIFGLYGGIYTVTVIDNNGCIAGALVNVAEPSILATAIITSSPASCNGTCDGLATVATGGGVLPHSYLWTDGQTSTTAIGLCAGNHSIVVTDGAGCTAVNNAIIGQPDLLVISDSINDASCFGLSDGSIYLTITGGTQFYLYTWSPSGGFNDFATNLTPDTYTIMVTDINSCVATSIVTVAEPDVLTSSSTSTPATCGLDNGIVSVAIAGGTAPYTYLWDDPQNSTTSTVSSLFPR